MAEARCNNQGQWWRRLRRSIEEEVEVDPRQDREEEVVELLNNRLSGMSLHSKSQLPPPDKPPTPPPSPTAAAFAASSMPFNRLYDAIAAGASDTALAAWEWENHLQQQLYYYNLQQLRQLNHRPQAVEGQQYRGRRRPAADIRPFYPANEVAALVVQKDKLPFLVDFVMKSPPEIVRKVFMDVKENLLDLMVHSTGHEFVQFLIELSAADIELRMEIVRLLTVHPSYFIRVCTHAYGAQVIQTLVRHLRIPEWECQTEQERLICELQKRLQNLIVSAILPDVVYLIKDDKARNVLDQCRKTFEYDCFKAIYYELARNCFEISTHKQGCIEIQNYIVHAEWLELELLANEIIKDALELSQHTSGNFVVQCLIKLMVPNIITRIFQQLQGWFQTLSTQKISSNVVQKLLLLTSEQEQERIIRELTITEQCALQVLQDPFGNYIMQDAWIYSKLQGRPVFKDLDHLIRKHMKFLEGHQFGKYVAFVVKTGKVHQSRRV